MFIKHYIYAWRGTVVEWLETLGYGAESPQEHKIETGLHHPTMKTLSVNLAVNGYLFQIWKGEVSERKG